MRHSVRLLVPCLLATVSVLVGCFETKRPLEYLGDADLQYYEDSSMEIAHPNVNEPTPEEVTFSGPPHTIRDRQEDEVWDLSLQEAIHIALQNNKVIRSNATFRSSGNPILANGPNAPSVYDPAITQTNVLFGRRGIEAALSAFDTTLAAQATWSRDEIVANSAGFGLGGGVGFPPGASIVTEGTDVSRVGTTTGIGPGMGVSLEKTFATGGSVSVQHGMNYTGTNTFTELFPSSYRGFAGVGVRQPLLAGSGVEFNRIAGPTPAGLGAITGVSQGVVISRINEDLTLAELEQSVRDLLRDVESVYWDLYLQYRLYEAAVVARNAQLETWRVLEKRREVGGVEGFTKQDEPQARDAYFRLRAAAQESLGNLYSTETRLRRLLGLPVNDGKVIRPKDEPYSAPLEPDWYASLTEALTQRVELRKQKWNIKSLELQLRAARSLVRPSLDFVSEYHVNAFGDQLLGYGSDDDAAGTPQGLRYAYETLTQGEQQGWTVGMQFSMPLGFRFANTQVRNLELRLNKARKVLATQELEIAHELAIAFQNVSANYAAAQSQFNRRIAAFERRRILDEQEAQGAGADVGFTYDLEVRAITDAATATRDYFTSLVNYNKALLDLEYRKGTLLEANNVHLAEDEWDPEAYKLAIRRAEARSHAFDASRFLDSEPEVFAFPGLIGEIPVVAPDGAVQGGPGELPLPDVERPGGDVEMLPEPDNLDGAAQPRRGSSDGNAAGGDDSGWTPTQTSSSDEADEADGSVSLPQSSPWAGGKPPAEGGAAAPPPSAPASEPRLLPPPGG